MSDISKDLSKQYEDNVLGEDRPRSIGLFPIPEHPEFERRGMWSSILEITFTTLRYLAPAALLTLFWGQQSFLFKLLKYIDTAFRAIVFSSDEQKEAVLKWLVEVSPVDVDNLDTLWQNGWILCGVLDAALPGACAGHPPTRLSITHAQAIADQYLGVEPIFTRQELECNDALSKHQEWKLVTYLDCIRESLSKVTLPISKPTPQRTTHENHQCTLDYVAKGLGLTAAQVNNVMFFKIYPTAQQSLEPKDIHVLIRGPKDTYGMTVIPPLLGKAQVIRQKLLGLQKKSNYTENVLPITHGAAYLRNYGRNNMNKTYHIPKTKYDIEVEAELQQHYAKIGYLVNMPGKYEISVTTRGQNILGSPFSVTATNNIISTLERDSFCLEDGEEIDIVDINNDKRVVLRIVDFVNEKMLLNENGSFEKITDEEAKFLMASEKNETQTIKEIDSDLPTKMTTFKEAAEKVIVMKDVIKLLSRQNNKFKVKPTKEDTSSNSTSQLNIPDIVNSTFSEVNLNPFSTSNKVIVPETIEVSLTSDKSKNMPNHYEANNPFMPDSLDKYHTAIEDESIIGRTTPLNNPFTDDNETQRYVNENKLGMFVNTEYETNKPHTEETQGRAFKVIVEEQEDKVSIPERNSFLDPDVIHLERPKTPILKIITGEVNNRKESVYVDTITEKLLQDELMNPFSRQSLKSNGADNIISSPITDFIIGAPVSLIPNIKILSPKPAIESPIMAANDDIFFTVDIKETEKPIEVFPTMSQEKYNVEKNILISSASQSFDSSLSGNLDDDNNVIENVSDFLSDGQRYAGSDSFMASKRDIWDSAYVSIDDNNISPDSNNNEQSITGELPITQVLSYKPEDFSNMGPAELEIWQNSGFEEPRPGKFELTRRRFTPILEENEKCIIHQSSVTECTNKAFVPEKFEEPDPVTVAFAEINSIYSEYFPNSDCNFSADSKNVDKLQTKETEYTVESCDLHVDSASELLSDVKRRASEIEGEISEVQANVTESVSASQTLQCTQNNLDCFDKIGQKFGDKTNIVLERKKYWDEKICQIKAAEEREASKSLHRKKRLSERYLRHNDSLTKRRGKEMLKRILSTDKEAVDSARRCSLQRQMSVDKEAERCESHLVEKWKKYWDDKLETQEDNIDTACFGTKVHKKQKDDIEKCENLIDYATKAIKPKQELAEEVFKAFETSPKRFFGTSRKQILNKIDSFLAQTSTTNEISEAVSDTNNDSGLVSSRVSLFHNMSQKEDLSWKQWKSKSMHDINNDKEDVLQKGFYRTSIDIETITIEDQKTIDTFGDSKSEKSQNEDFVLKEKPHISFDDKSLKDKRAQLTNILINKSVDEVLLHKNNTEERELFDKRQNVKKTIHDINKQSHDSIPKLKLNVLRKTCFSKSEMDIFRKDVEIVKDNYLDKHRSCEELPKTSVKNFISLFETVSKSSIDYSPRKLSKTNSFGSQKKVETETFQPGYVKKNESQTATLTHRLEDSSKSSEAKSVSIPQRHRSESKICDSINEEQRDVRDNFLREESQFDNEKESTYVSLSDIELEIIENKSDITSKESAEENVGVDKDYKSRYKTAKDYFKSLEESKEDKKHSKLNECEILLYNLTESPEKRSKQKKRIKKNIKSRSMDSSELSKHWKQLRENSDSSDGTDNQTKPVTISDKFNIEDFFADVTEGKLSRQGSLRGIPHKKAVLETFKSMENVSNSNMSPYEIAVSQLKDFAKDNDIKNAQTYLSEYPYLPKTDPSKYHSRLDVKASGLISMKELLNKPRRNSVPDLRLNTAFVVDL